MNDLETALRWLLGKNYVQYFNLSHSFTYPQHLYAPTDLTTKKINRDHLFLLLRRHRNGQALYEYYLTTMEAYACRRLGDLSPYSSNARG